MVVCASSGVCYRFSAASPAGSSAPLSCPRWPESLPERNIWASVCLEYPTVIDKCLLYRKLLGK